MRQGRKSCHLCRSALGPARREEQQHRVKCDTPREAVALKVCEARSIIAGPLDPLGPLKRSTTSRLLLWAHVLDLAMACADGSLRNLLARLRHIVVLARRQHTVGSRLGISTSTGNAEDLFLSTIVEAHADQAV